MLAPSVPIFAGDNKGSSFSMLRKKRLAELAPCGEQEVNLISVLIDSTAQVTPLAADFEVGSIDSDRTTMRAQPLLDHRCIGKNPAVDRAMVHFESRADLAPLK